MAYLILGLLIFLGVHSVRIVAEGWRTRTRESMGEWPYRGVFSLISLLGFGLIVWGFGIARQTPTILWAPPLGMRHAASLLTLFAFVFAAAAYVPKNSIKARLHHPLVLAVKTWALAHLLSNGNSPDMLLFGAFLAWGVVDFIAARRRDRAEGIDYPSGTAAATAITIVVGVAAWVLFAFKLHGMLIGPRPFGY